MTSQPLRSHRRATLATLAPAGIAALAVLLLPALLSGAAVAHTVAASNVQFGNGRGHGGGGGTGSCGTGIVTQTSSSNWGGYAAETCLSSPATNVVSDVKGSWTQPSVQCGPSASYSAFWVGIDGYSSSTVEQTGTDSDCASGAPSYYAWYEFYPAYPVNLPTTQYPVVPGDVITAEVQWISGSTFQVSLADLTHPWTFSTTGSVSNAQRSSAEWIAEAPSSGHVLPLADFGTVDFTACTATIGGTTGAIQDASWAAAEITMSGKNYVKAAPSSLSGAGEDFSVTWHHS